MKRINVKEFFIQLRNGLAFCFSWIVLCVLVMSKAYGSDSISAGLLLKVFVLCLWAVLTFIICFTENIIRKKGFILRLTLFYVLFIPCEILMFYRMGVFKGTGSGLQWGIFAALIICLYTVCVLIDWLVCRKQGTEYTRRLLAYNERRANERQHENTGDGTEGDISQ